MMSDKQNAELMSVMPVGYIGSAAGKTTHYYKINASGQIVKVPNVEGGSHLGVAICIQTTVGPLTIFLSSSDYQALLLDASRVEEELARLSHEEASSSSPTPLNFVPPPSSN